MKRDSSVLLPSGENTLGTPPASGEASVILVGNPNVGKSLLFKNLTNHYVTVSNFPGTTVEIVRARARFNSRQTDIIDTPGINDLAPRSDDSRVTRNILDQHPEAIIVQVADAKNLRRALLLTLQLAEFGRPMVLVLNMQDELQERGGRINTTRLSRLLGVPVVETVAPRNQGTAELVAALSRACPLAVVTGPVDVADDEYEVNRIRLARVNDILAETYSISQPDHASLRVRLGFWAMHPIRGLGIAAAVLLAVFWFVGLFGAGTLVDLLEVGVFQQRLSPLAIRVVDATLVFPHEHSVEVVSHPVGFPATPLHEVTVTTLMREVVTPYYEIGHDTDWTALSAVARFVHDFLVGEYGVITMALSYALAIVLPIVTTFFLVFSVLEDSGYFPRMAIMVSRVFRIMGLNGKAVLPMILGLGCATMATMATRILETRKERIIAILLLALAVPCSAQLGVLLAMMSALAPGSAIVWVSVVMGMILLIGWLTARIIPGEPSPFILEIPPLRRPQLSNVYLKTASRIKWYLNEVIPLFVLGTALLFLMDKLHLLEQISRLGEPLITGWLGLPPQMANAFLVGFLRRDFGAVYILDAAIGPGAVLTPHQILVAMITITLFMPCFANFLMIAKEQGSKVALCMAAFIFPFAFFVGGLVHWLGTWLTST